MKPYSTYPFLAVLICSPLLAESTVQFEEKTSHPRGEFGMNLQGLLKLDVSFHNVGSLPSATNPGTATGSDQDRNYDDGYNRVDWTGNTGDLTANWGYANASQVAANDTLVMNSSTALGAKSEGDNDEIHPGLELYYKYQLTQDDQADYVWWLRAGISYTYIDIDNSSDSLGDVSVTSDAYELNGITPPAPGYSGSFNSVGPLIGSDPSRSVNSINGGARSSAEQDIDAHLLTFAVGPQVSALLNENIQLSAGAGVSLSYFQSDFSFKENITVTGVGSNSLRGSTSDDDFLLGAYFELGLSVKLSDNVHAHTSVNYQMLEDFSQKTNSREADFDLNGLVGLKIGISYLY